MPFGYVRRREEESGQRSADASTETLRPDREAPKRDEAAPTSAEPSSPDTATRSVTRQPQPPAPTRQARRKAQRAKGAMGFLRELPVLLLVAFLLALLIKTFLVQAFYIPSQSMEPTLKVGDRVLVNKVSYHLHPPHRGDVIVFEEPHPTKKPHRGVFSAFWHWLTQGLGVSTNPEKDFIKRVIALPGETIEIKNGKVFINGKRIKERYLNKVKDTRDFPPTKVPHDSLFVMGDNRTDSNDSRFGLRFIPYDKVVGRAFVIIWPPSRVRLVHGVHYKT